MKKILRSRLCQRCNYVLEHSKNMNIRLFLIGFFLIGNMAHSQLPQFEDFEGGYGTWNDGGSDAHWMGSTLLNGWRNVRLRDNSGVSSSIYSNSLNLTPYTSVTFEFLYYADSMENGENFFVEYDDGSGYVVIANYRRGIEFNNNVVYSESITITSTDYTFGMNSRFRIRCDASGDWDYVYIDDISITGVMPPLANDDCSDAITIVSDETCTYTTGTTFTATQSLSGCAGLADDDVWFSFTALTSEHTIEVDPITLNDAVFEVFDSCGGTSLACIDGTGGSSMESTTVSGLTVGNTYYIRVYSYSNGSNQQGTFNICVTNSCIPSTALGTTTLACPSVNTGGIGLDGEDPLPINCSEASTTTTLEADFLNLGDTSSYIVQSIPYSPPYQFSCLANQVDVSEDDVWSPVVNLPFDFCFYGNTYNSCVIGSNGVISFDDSLANGPTGWYTSRDVPNSVNAEANGGVRLFFGPSIYGVHHDVDPSVGGEIGYQLITLDSGCRALVAAWSDVPMYDDNSLLYTGMIVFYEDTNIIEVYIKEKQALGSWNSGNASVALQASATEGIAAPNRNTRDPNWTTFNEAWRFVPDGPTITSLKWYENSISAANEIIDPDNDGQITVTPTNTTTYIAEVTYNLCNSTTLIETDATTITLTGDKVWNGSQNSDWNNPNNWTPVGVPVKADCVLIPDTLNDPVISGVVDGKGHNLEIADGATLIQQPNSSLTIEDAVIVNNDAEFEIRDSANFIQVIDVLTNQNMGSAKVQREVTGLNNYDYVYWSSPVEGFDVSDVSPSTSSYGIYEWLPTVENGSPGKHGEWSIASGIMTNGQGYAIRDLEGTLIDDVAQFEGKLNNGQITHYITRGIYNGLDYVGNGNIATAEDDNWNLMGNPYPSAISLDEFTAANPYIDGTLYFWRHNAPPSTSVTDPFYQDYQYNYTANDYLSANSLGSTPPGFNGYIAAGQGFFVQLLNSAPRPSGIIFSNSMRGVYDNSGFYRSIDPTTATETENHEKHRIWLDLINENNTALSALIGYATGATDALDRLYDGHLLNDTNYQFYSIATVDNMDKKLSINGLALPFEDSDSIPLGYKASEQGELTIAINSLDGLFAYSGQNIYLEDTALNIIHDLKTSPYVFATDEGTFDDRFVLRFTTQSLSIKDQDVLTNLTIKAMDQVIDAKSELSAIKTFALYDVTGKLIHHNINIEAYSYRFPTNNLSKGAYIVKVSLANGSTVSKKLII